MRSTSRRGPAYEVQTERLLLRCWDPADAPDAQAAMERSDADLRRFIPMPLSRPLTLDEMVARLRQHRAAFDRDEHYRFAVRTKAGVFVGEAMLLDREQIGARELGYWMDRAHCGEGYATEAATALVRLAFEVEAVSSVELGCARDNHASVAIAHKLGFEHLSTTEREAPLSPEDRWSMQWSLWSTSYRSSKCATTPMAARDALGRALFGDGSFGDGSFGDASFGDGSFGDGSFSDGSFGDGSFSDGSFGDGSCSDGSPSDDAPSD